MVKKKNGDLIASLETFLTWLQSGDYPQESFHSVAEYGYLHYSIDEMISEAVALLYNYSEKEEEEEK